MSSDLWRESAFTLLILGHLYPKPTSKASSTTTTHFGSTRGRIYLSAAKGRTLFLMQEDPLLHCQGIHPCTGKAFFARIFSLQPKEFAPPPTRNHISSSFHPRKRNPSCTTPAKPTSTPKNLPFQPASPLNSPPNTARLIRLRSIPLRTQIKVESQNLRRWSGIC